MLKSALIHVILVLVLVTPFFNKGLAKKCVEDSSETELYSENSYESWKPSSHQLGNCNCTFNYQTDLMTAFIGNRTLNVEDEVKRGERVTFKCRYDSMDIVWPNGLRFYKRMDISCYVCQKWEKHDLPHCDVRSSVDSYVDYNPKMNFLPGGVIEIQKSENLTMKCKNFGWQPRWNYERKEGIDAFRDPIDTVIRTKYFSQTIVLTNLDFQHSGRYECSTPNYYGKLSRSTYLDLNVIAPCTDDPPVIENAVPVITNIDHRAVMWYKCDPGFEKKKFGLMKCDNATWVGEKPICDEKYKDCDNFTNANANGVEVFYTHDVRVGSIAIFLCPPATRLVGQSYAICRRWGTWSHPLPLCEVPSCSIETLVLSLTEHFLDLRNITDEFLPIDSVVTLECIENATLMGNPKVTCGSAGEWEIGEVSCIPDVPGCKLRINVASQLRVDPIKNRYEFGEFVLLSCPPGLQLNKETERVMCLGESWSDTLPECV